MVTIVQNTGLPMSEGGQVEALKVQNKTIHGSYDWRG